MIEVEPVELKITLVTNIPGANDYKSNKNPASDYEKGILTFSTLYVPDLKIEEKIRPTKYPYFTFQVKYDEATLSRLDYSSVVKTFFSLEKFIDEFGNYSDIISKFPPSDADASELDTYYKTRTTNINNNVMLMLKYLLPTKFPVINNQFNSYDLFKGVDSMGTFLFNPMKQHNYVYLNLTSGRYTLKKVIWLNDFLNHPDYRKELLSDELNKTKFKIITRSSNHALENYISKNNIVKALPFIKSCYKTKCSSEIADLLYVGMQIQEKRSSEPYEIFLDVELIESEIKPGEEGKLKCPYYGDYLGEELIRMMRESKPQFVKKQMKGQVTKMPLYFPSKMTSKKLGDVGTEVEKVDEALLKKRKEEDIMYNDIEIDARNNYETTINPFLEDMEKKNLRLRIKRYDINKKTFYKFLDDKLSEMLDYITLSLSDKSDPNNAINEVKYARFRKVIDLNLKYYSDPKIPIRTGENDKNKLLFELSKELLDYITPPDILKVIKEQERSGVVVRPSAVKEEETVVKKKKAPLKRKTTKGGKYNKRNRTRRNK